MIYWYIHCLPLRGKREDKNFQKKSLSKFYKNVYGKIYFVQEILIVYSQIYLCFNMIYHYNILYTTILQI